LLAGANTPSSSGRGVMHVYEGAAARLSDYIVVNQGDAGTILKVESIDGASTDLTGKVTFVDVVTGENQVITVSNGSGVIIGDANYTYTATVNAWGGTGYTVGVNSTFTGVAIKWTAAATTELYSKNKVIKWRMVCILDSYNCS